jgi:hypothetical protein
VDTNGAFLEPGMVTVSSQENTPVMSRVAELHRLRGSGGPALLANPGAQNAAAR